MPDDERTRRRLGDATKARINDLAAGWSVDAEPARPPSVPDATPTLAPEPTRARRKTQPPPPPGSQARKELEKEILETSDTIDEEAKPRGEVILAATRGPKNPTKPPPIPAAAIGKATASETALPPLPPAKLPIDPARAPTAAASSADLARAATLRAKSVSQPPPPPVPVKEFDDSSIRKTNIATSPFERGDPTSVQQEGDEDATSIQRPSTRMATVGATVRATSALRRKRGVVGDVFYVFTALLGVRSARRELVLLDEKHKARQASRKRNLTVLGRTAVAADGFDHPALGKTREALAVVEDERSKHAGAVAASDAELERVRRDRDTAQKAHATAIAEADAELTELAKKLEPLDKEAAAARKRADDLADQIRKIGRKIADTEALLVSVKSEKMDRAAIQADIATLKADRKAIQRDEPEIAGELDALDPKIAGIRAQRTEAEKRKAEVIAAEADDLRRTTELYEAIGAKRKVVERAAADAEAARDKVLFELGERLYVDRPSSLAAQLSPIDQIDLELGESDRRGMELREILSNVDRMKLFRGIAVIVLTLGAVGAFVAWLLVMLT